MQYRSCKHMYIYIYIYMYALVSDYFLTGMRIKKLVGDFVEFFTSRDGGLNRLKKKVGNLLQKFIGMIRI